MNQPGINPDLEMFRTILDQMLAGVLLADESGNILYVNEFMVKISGYTKEEIIQGTWIKQSDNATAAERFFTSCREKKPVPEHKTGLVTKFGRQLWLSVSVEVLSLGGGLDSIMQFNIVDSTEMTSMFKVLQESEEKYKCIVENSHDTVMINRPDRSIVYISPSSTELTGYAPEELCKDNTGIVHPDDLAFAEEQFQLACQGIPGKNIVYRIVTKSGQVKWISHSWSSIVTYDNQKQFVSVMNDITESKQTHEALWESEKRYRGLIESQFDMIVRVDTENRFTFANEAYCKAFGKTTQELYGKSFTPLVHEDDLPKTLEEMQKLKYPPYRCYVEQRAFTVQGWRWLAWEDCAILDENGNTVEIQAVGRDITNSKTDHENLVKSEERLRSLISNSSGAVYRLVYKDDWCTEYLSQAIEMISGYPPEYFLEKPVAFYTDLVHPDEVEDLTKTVLENVDKHEPYVLEYRIVRKDGSTRWITDKGQGIYDASGKLLSLDGIIFDITDRKNSEEELRKAYNIQKEFLNNITHEVRTPLTAVQGYVQMLLEGMLGPVSSEQTALLNKVLMSSNHLLNIVTGVLEVARTKSGAIQLRPKICSPAKIVETAVSSIMPQATKKGLDIDLEKMDVSCCGIYDEQKLTIILTNLLTNAVKFTHKGYIKVEVSCNEKGTEIIVVDTGIGIDPKALDTIYDEFIQLGQPNKHKPGGFGIGLAIAAAMVETINGALTVSSVPNIGTAFTLFAPILDS